MPFGGTCGRVVAGQRWCLSYGAEWISNLFCDKLIRHRRTNGKRGGGMQRDRGLSSDVSHVPSALHGQLFLLAFDPKRGRFARHGSGLFALALGAAMLT